MSVHVHRPASLPGVAVVVIDSPKTVNAITQVMLLSLAKAFRDLRVDRTVRAAVLTATGRRAFSTGIDLGDAERVFKMDESRLDDDIVHQMELCPFPIIGAVNGVAINAGFELALACDVLLASPRASFRDTHAAFGILPSWGLSQKLPRIVGANVARMTSLTSAPLTATDARRCGLVNAIVHEADDAHDMRDVDADLHDMMAGGGVAGGADALGADASASSRSPGEIPADLPGKPREKPRRRRSRRGREDRVVTPRGGGGVQARDDGRAGGDVRGGTRGGTAEGVRAVQGASGEFLRVDATRRGADAAGEVVTRIPGGRRGDLSVHENGARVS